MFKQKLKITDDRVEIIQKILPNFEVRVTDKNNGICVKCFKNVEKSLCSFFNAETPKLANTFSIASSNSLEDAIFVDLPTSLKKVNSDWSEKIMNIHKKFTT